MEKNIEKDVMDNYMLVHALQTLSCSYNSHEWDLKDAHPLNSTLCKLQGISTCFGSIGATRCSNSSITVKGKHAGTLWSPNVDVLLQEAKPAPFGKGEETVLDETVRKVKLFATTQNKPQKGLQITAADLCIEGKDMDFIPLDIQVLAPENHVLVPKLYKMHIYQKGGHFKQHVDTQHGPDHLATLVISLPHPFVGGNLVVSDHDEEKSFSLSSGCHIVNDMPDTDSELVTAPKDIKQKKKLHWVAFYTDCKHHVEEVFAGVRIVLQFDLYAFPVVDPNINDKSLSYLHTVMVKNLLCMERDDFNTEKVWVSTKKLEDPAFSEIAKLLRLELTEIQVTTEDIDDGQQKESSPTSQSQDSMSEPQKPGKKPCALILKHSYSLNSLKPELLKGVDGLLWNYLKGHFTLRLVPLVLKLVDYREDESFVSVYPFDEKHIQLYAKGGSYKKQKTEPNSEEEKATVYVGSRQSERLQLYSQSYIEYTGNEAQPAQDIYFVCSIVVDALIQ
jgi:hypothetical protein